ncbi:HAD family hydrolase [Halothiobacillus sp. DCM-1]|uniref:HAD family hydrolase n=1 Tax=Halothiobacillus sp. DCM-1 TaxID=3112558 RepID=UPI0032439A11
MTPTPLSRPQLIVFDWDGTLVQSTGHIIRCFQQAIAAEALPERDPQTIANIIGLGLLEASQTLFPEASPTQVAALAEAYRHVYFQRTERLELYPGAESVLQTLQAAGCFLAIATGKSNRGLREALDETGLGHYFLATRTAEQTVSKPAPLMLLELFDELGVMPHESWMVGDTDFDLLMAHNAGCQAIAITHGAHEVARLHAARPQVIITELNELIPLFCATAPENPQS